MSFTLIHGPAGSRKQDSLLSEWIKKNDAVYLLPTRQNVLEVQKKILRTRPGLIGKNILTLDSWLMDLCKHNHPEVHKATPLLSRTILRQLLSQKKYPSFERAAGLHGLVDALARSISRLKANGLTPAMAKALLIRAKSHLAEDFVALYEDAFTLMRELCHFENGDALLFLQMLLDQKRLTFPENLKTVYVDRFFPLTPGERKFLTELSGEFPRIDIIISLSQDYDDNEDPYLYPAYEELGNKAGRTDYAPLKASSKFTNLVLRHASAHDEIESIIQKIKNILGENIKAEDVAIVVSKSVQDKLIGRLIEENIPFQTNLRRKSSFFRALNLSHLDLSIKALAHKTSDYSATHLSCIKTAEFFLKEWDFQEAMLKDKTGLKLPPKLVNDILDYELSQLTITYPTHSAGLFVGRLEEVASQDWQHVFVADFCATTYPTSRESLLSTPEMQDDKLLREVFRAPSYVMALEKNLFRQLIHRTQRGVQFSFSQKGGEDSLPALNLLPAGDQYQTDVINVMIESTPARQVVPSQKTEGKGFFKKRFSFSELECYQTCPFQYYARHVLRLGDLDEEETDVSPDIKGNFVHLVLDKLFKNFKPLYFDATEYDVYLERLLQACTQIAEEEYKTFKDFLSHPKVLTDSFKERAIEALHELLRTDVLLYKNREKKSLPSHFEWTFGKGDIPPLVINDDDDAPIELSGRIDRIDINDIDKSFLVIDYKTGKIPSTKALREGSSLQLPLYVMAVQKLLLPDHLPSGAVFMGLREVKISGLVTGELGDAGMLSRSQISLVEWEVLQNKIVEQVKEIIHHIKLGHFDPKPESTADCTRCNYRNICHYQADDKDE